MLHAPTPEQTKAFLTVWHKAVLGRDVSLLDPWVDEAATIASPAFWTPKGPKAYVMQILKSVTFRFEDLTYAREWIDGRELSLEFAARIGDIRLRGIDRISLDAKGHMQAIEVFIRPANALVALADLVKRDLGPLSA